MSSENNYIDWVKHLPSKDEEYENCLCLECGNTGLLYQYFGTENSDFGWKIVWCNTCNSGINISRTKLPENRFVLFDNDEQDKFIENHSNLRFVF